MAVFVGHASPFGLTRAILPAGGAAGQRGSRPRPTLSVGLAAPLLPVFAAAVAYLQKQRVFAALAVAVGASFAAQ